MTQFDIHRNKTTGDYEIVASRRKMQIVVQTNIKTVEKAVEALRTWRKQEHAHAQG